MGRTRKHPVLLFLNFRYLLLDYISDKMMKLGFKTSTKIFSKIIKNRTIEQINTHKQKFSQKVKSIREPLNLIFKDVNLEFEERSKSIKSILPQTFYCEYFEELMRNLSTIKSINTLIDECKKLNIDVYIKSLIDFLSIQASMNQNKSTDELLQVFFNDNNLNIELKGEELNNFILRECKTEDGVYLMDFKKLLAFLRQYLNI